MAKLWSKSTLVPWLCNETEQNFFASIGKYRMEINQVKKSVYEVQVFMEGKPLVSKEDSIISTKNRAIGFAEGIYLAYNAMDKFSDIRFFKSAVS